VTSSLIGGGLSSWVGSEVTEDQRREMLAYDWFMSDSLTQPGRQREERNNRSRHHLVMIMGFV